MDTTKTRGVIFTATFRARYAQQALQAAESIKRYADIPICIFTDLQIPPSEFVDEVRECKHHDVGHNQYMLDRLVNLKDTPYDYTLALDTDILAMCDLQHIFDVLDEFDIAMCHGHNREKRRELAAEVTDVPAAFTTVQGGLILYRKCPEICRYLNELVWLYKEKQYFDDQISMRELLWRRRDLRLCILPPEYNFSSKHDLKRWGQFGEIEAKPKIFHYTRHKADPKRIVRQYDSGAFASYTRTHK